MEGESAGRMTVVAPTARATRACWTAQTPIPCAECTVQCSRVAADLFSAKTHAPTCWAGEVSLEIGGGERME